MQRLLWAGLVTLLLAGSALAQLHVWPSDWDFGPVTIGTEEWRWIWITNEGTSPLEVSASITGEAFHMDFPISVTLQPGDSGLVVPVGFAPREVQHYTGEVQFFTTDPLVPTATVPLEGDGREVPDIPPMVMLLSPENATWFPAVPVTIEWEPLDVPGAPAITYDVWILAPDSSAHPPMAMFSAGSATSYTLTDTTYGPGFYLWWVAAHWPGDSSLSVEIRSFYIGTPPAEESFDLLAPANEATVTLPTATFTWNRPDYWNVNPALYCSYTLLIFPEDTALFPDRVLFINVTDTSVEVDLTELADQERCWWYVIAHFSDGHMVYSRQRFAFNLGINPRPAPVDDPTAPLVKEFGIAGVAPNPFNPETRITLAVPQAGRVTATVYDVLGRQVATLVDGPLSAGTHSLSWRPAGPTGIYLLRVQNAQGQGDVRRLLFIK